MGVTVSIDPRVLVVVVVIPMLVMWAVVLVDIALQPLMRGRAKAFWVILCTLFWPAQILYWMTRPMQGRVERPEGRTDPHARLVQGALDREAGCIDDSAWAALVRDLRG